MTKNGQVLQRNESYTAKFENVTNVNRHKPEGFLTYLHTYLLHGAETLLRI